MRGVLIFLIESGPTEEVCPLPLFSNITDGCLLKVTHERYVDGLPLR